VSPNERLLSRVTGTLSREFRPNYLSFAGTYQCNLTCPHCCVPIEWTDRLDIPTAVRFLEQAHAAGIRILGFTGGEPFLFPEFLVALTRRASQLGFRFDKLMTNGVWFQDDAQLRSVLTSLREAGFSGKVGLSIDKFHGIKTAQLAQFCRITREVFDRDTILSLSYASASPEKGLEPIEKLKQELDGILEWSDLLGRYLLVTPELTMTLNWNHLAPVERAEKLPGNPWDGEWFEEDYCEGPGQALIVNPKGEVKPCCGFASDLEQLSIGNIYRDSVEQVISNGRNHPYVGKLFREGLTRIRDEILARNPEAFPDATSNHCFFCWHVLSQNLFAVPAANGRICLPLTTADKPSTRFLMNFDGRTVYLHRELPNTVPSEKGRWYLVNVAGPTPFAPPPEKMIWAEYQTWLDRMRDEGFTLTTHDFSPVGPDSGR
jgi:organic radical activating enzyme